MRLLQKDNGGASVGAAGFEPTTSSSRTMRATTALRSDVVYGTRFFIVVYIDLSFILAPLRQGYGAHPPFLNKKSHLKIVGWQRHP